MKKLIVFDLDGTLAESKAPVDAEMAGLLKALLCLVDVAVISGGGWPQFETQILGQLPHDAVLKNLSLLPTCGTKFYRYSGDWTKIYSEDFTSAEKTKIIASLNKALDESGVRIERLWGEAIEDGAARLLTLRSASRLHWKKKRNGTPTMRSGRKSLRLQAS